MNTANDKKTRGCSQVEPLDFYKTKPSVYLKAVGKNFGEFIRWKGKTTKLNHVLSRWEKFFALLYLIVISVVIYLILK